MQFSLLPQTFVSCEMERLHIVVAVVLAAQCAITGARKLPPGIKPCSRNDPKINECAMRNANAAIPLIAKGNPSYGMFPLDPLFISEFRVDDTGSSRQVALDLSTNDVTITGLRHEKITSFDVDLAKRRVSWGGFVPRLEMRGRYKVAGRVLILPLSGSGAMNITLDGVHFNYTFEMADAGIKDGKKFVKPINNFEKFRPERMHISMENLFNGEKALSDQMNVFLNENWREMLKDLGPPITEVMSEATNQFIGAFMKLVPFDEIFTDEPAKTDS